VRSRDEREDPGMGYGDNYDKSDWDDCVVELADGSKLHHVEGGDPGSCEAPNHRQDRLSAQSS